jgi:dTDP-4-amino-4,6-dideoxygalactose transaminase
LLEGVCPLFFPIIVENSLLRNNLYRILKSRGITTHPWWNRFHPAVPWDKFRDAVYLKERLLGLPIHQDLTFKHLDFLIKEFEKAFEAA